MADLLTLPVFGIGLPFLLYTYLQLRNATYQISAKEVIHGKLSIPYDSITRVRITEFTVLKNGNIASVIVESGARTITLKGIRDATKVQHIIETAVEAIRREASDKGSREPAANLRQAGQLEQLNDLVGLWQQGLLTDEEYQKENSKLKNY